MKAFETFVVVIVVAAAVLALVNRHALVEEIVLPLYYSIF